MANLPRDIEVVVPVRVHLRVGGQGSGCTVQVSGCRVEGSRCRVEGAGCRVEGAECRVQGPAPSTLSAGCRVQGAGFRVQGAWFRAGTGVAHKVRRRADRTGGGLRFLMNEVTLQLELHG